MEIAQSYARLALDKLSVVYLRDSTYLTGPFDLIEVSQDVFLKVRETGATRTSLIPAWAILRVDRRD